MTRFLPSQSMSATRSPPPGSYSASRLLLLPAMVMAWKVRKARPAPATPAIQKNMLPSMWISHSLLLRPVTSEGAGADPVTMETRSDMVHRGLARIRNNCSILLRRS